MAQPLQTLDRNTSYFCLFPFSKIYIEAQLIVCQGEATGVSFQMETISGSLEETEEAAEVRSDVLRVLADANEPPRWTNSL